MTYLKAFLGKSPTEMVKTTNEHLHMPLVKESAWGLHLHQWLWQLLQSFPWEISSSFGYVFPLATSSPPGAASGINSCHASGKTFQRDKSPSSPLPGLSCQFSPHAFQTGPSAKDTLRQDVWGLIVWGCVTGYPRARHCPSVSLGFSLLSIKEGKLFLFTAQ